MNISLLHPCYHYKENNGICNDAFAKDTQNIDLLIGGHSHTFFDNLVRNKIKKRDEVIVNQMDWARIVSGIPDFEFSKFWGKKNSKITCYYSNQKNRLIKIFF
jgi:5'-nucleotidase